MTTVGEDFPKQQIRVRDVLKAYQDIGPNGALGAMLISNTLKEAEEAAISGDIVRILRAYESLKQIDY